MIFPAMVSLIEVNSVMDRESFLEICRRRLRLDTEGRRVLKFQIEKILETSDGARYLCCWMMRM